CGGRDLNPRTPARIDLESISCHSDKSCALRLLMVFLCALAEIYNPVSTIKEFLEANLQTGAPYLIWGGQCVTDWILHEW
ncbi:MAG: hypothetical protein O8C56_01795, partial [Candidatus Methanoperedens sp.]|nr:hypothetical protein [Candidatus Methanoperedens sp.]